MSDNNQKTDAWGQNKNIPDSWGKNNKLPENWGKQSSNADSGTPSVRTKATSSSSVENTANLSDKAKSGIGLLAGAAKKVGGAAKNAAGNAVEYAKSDDVKDKLNAAKNKAKSIADGAGSSLADMKEKTSNAINERRVSKSELSDDNTSDEIVEDMSNTAIAEDTPIAVSFDDTSIEDDEMSAEPSAEADTDYYVPDEADDEVYDTEQEEEYEYVKDVVAEMASSGSLKKNILIGAAVLAVGIGTIIGVGLIFKKGDKKPSSNDSSIETTAETSTAATSVVTTVETTTDSKQSSTTTVATTSAKTETTTANANEINKNKILASVDNDEYAGKDSHIENAPADMSFNDIDENLSQITITNPVLYSGPGSSYSEVYKSSASEKFYLVGENGDWYYLMFYAGTGRFTHMTYGFASKTPVSVQNTSKLSEEELGYMYNMFYIESLHGPIGGGYIEDYDNDGTDEAILSTANGGYQLVKYQNGKLLWSSYPNGSGYSYGQQLPNMKTAFYDWERISDRIRELAVSHGYTANQYFSIDSTTTESVDEYGNKVYSFGNTFIGYVKTSDIFSTLNLRSSPSTNSNVITQLPNGTLFHVIGAYDSNGNETTFYGSSPSWYLVELNINGTKYSGYVSGDYVHTWDSSI